MSGNNPQHIFVFLFQGPENNQCSSPSSEGRTQALQPPAPICLPELQVVMTPLPLNRLNGETSMHHLASATYSTSPVPSGSMLAPQAQFPNSQGKYDEMLAMKLHCIYYS
jgi:hypothetical protein